MAGARGATLTGILGDRAAETPDRAAYTYLSDGGGAETLSYREVYAAAADIATKVGGVGGPGDRVLVPSVFGPDFLTSFFGCMIAGRIPVPVANHQPGAAFSDMSAFAALALDCAASAILAPRAAVAQLRAASAEYPPLARLAWLSSDEPTGQLSEPLATDPDGVAFLQYTSGSTRAPRGVMVSHANLTHNLGVIEDAFGHTPDSKGVIWLPAHHDMGLIGGLLEPLYAGFPVVLMSPEAFIRDPLTWLRAISEHGGTTSGGPNVCYDYSVRRVSADAAASLDLSRWEVAFVAAEPINPRALQRFSDHFASSGFRPSSMIPGYGLAESTLFVSVTPRGAGVRSAQMSGRDVVSCGVVSGGSAIIVDLEGHTRLEDGAIGEIWLTGPSVAGGYWGKPDETEEAFHAKLPGDPVTYLRTGDLGFRRDDELFVTGRVKELIIIRGRNIAPQDIEWSIETQHPALRRGRCAAVGCDVDGTEALAVLLEVDASKLDVSIGELETSIRQTISQSYGLDTHRVVFLSPGQLPRTTSGKVQRLKARDMFLAENTESATPSVLDQLTRWLANQTGAEPATLDAEKPMTTLGLDSVKASEFGVYVEREFGYAVSAERLFEGLTMAGLAADIAGRHKVSSKQSSGPAALPAVGSSTAPVEFSLFFFASDAEPDNPNRYGLFLDCAEFADKHDFRAVWLPERHFHRFGGLFPNPAVLGGVLARTTERIRIRAGSVVLPLHDPVRVAEDWSVIDNLSGGRVDIAFATGWNPDDFVLAAADYTDREQVMLSGADKVRRLWRRESISLPNGKGEQIEVRTFPPAVQPELPLWITCSGGIGRFEQAGELGANVLTALLFQDIDELRTKIEAYRKARAAHGHDPQTGHVTLMLHTFLDPDEQTVRRVVEKPFKSYLRDSVDLWRRGAEPLNNLSDAEQERVLDYAFARYFHTSALLGTPERAVELIDQLAAVGVDEIACLVDFGVDQSRVLGGLRHLADLRNRWPGNPTPRLPATEPLPSAEQQDLGASIRNRHALAHRNSGGVLAKARDFDLARRLREADLLPFYPDLSDSDGATCRYEGRELIMLGSNNYLGLTADTRVREATAAAALKDGPSVTGSRLMNGSTPAHGDLERKLARFLGRPDALLFTTGYQANLGFLSAFMGEGTVLLVDEECHASIYDGAAIGGCRLIQFRHNDIADLDRRLRTELDGLPALVMVDGVYSMSGDIARLAEVREVCDRHGVPLAVDDAHGLGMIGATGRGVEEELGLPGAADILTGTFSKSLASVGGWLAGPRDLMDWVRYYGRAQLFSASIPPPAVAAAATALDILENDPARMAKLRELSAYWRKGLSELGFDTGTSRTTIVPVLIGDELRCLRFAKHLLDEGVYGNCVLAPAVPADRAMIRTTVTAVHEYHHLDKALAVFAKVGRELQVIED
ncbi:aminotransferase class I/II-fold pyridoxal phosphate-dependent enzyme [Nocardia colli]|uniref:Aminotransferase class I/II-fold pyridoxal phosphate-dependent enzyme n=1 Tax=Nocardia colli TaxID=2545717 RepID=A0A5N0E004_9NOCA|nr:MupA/Atu3671 family FMN-dependent luciferase-like monooxygenase [Nocardia colli]KAA8881970.1 aminotransferase class I/II-fold pyridoxal phosphate-dependent enzyme [Nocardia colli]